MPILIGIYRLTDEDKFRTLGPCTGVYPPNEKETARAFYCGILGLEEIEKQDALKPNGEFWLGDDGKMKERSWPALNDYRSDKKNEYEKLPALFTAALSG